MKGFQAAYEQTITPQKRSMKEQTQDASFAVLIKMLAFLVSLVILPIGIAIFVIWKNDRPKDAIWPGVGMVINLLLHFGYFFLTTFLSMIAQGKI